MMRTFTLSLAAVALLGLTACPKEQVSGGSSSSSGAPGSASSSSGEVTPTSTSGEVPTTGLPDLTTGTTTGTTSTSTGAESGSSSTGALLSTGTSTGSETGSSSGDATTGPPPRLFDCFGCDCDANVGFCRKVFAGVAAFAGPDPELCPTVDPDGLESGCVLYPADCAEPPSCACLPLMNGNCFCNESERSPGAFEVTCPLP